MKDIEYSYLDYQLNIPPPPKMKNAGLYTGDITFSKKPWGNNYEQPHIPPDATAYAAQFYAKHHIPSTNRPGNNYLNTNMYQFYDRKTYNFECYNK